LIFFNAVLLQWCILNEIYSNSFNVKDRYGGNRERMMRTWTNERNGKEIREEVRIYR
jgi:hypothetical protein